MPRRWPVWLARVTMSVASALRRLIDHIVVIVKENHTFDNYFGTFPGADGIALAQAQNPPPSDPDHTHQAWERRQADARYRVQYTARDIPVYFALARQYTLCDHHFSEVAGPSTPNHLMLIAADAPVINNPQRSGPPPRYRLTSLPAALERAGLTWANYGGYAFQYIEELAGHAAHYTSDRFVHDAAAAALPTVSWLYAEGVPSFSEHPRQNVTVGSQWTARQLEAIVAGQLWARTVVFITWDDWGGWFDHVMPPNLEPWDSRTAQRPADAFPEFDGQQFRYGSRVPCLVVSPYATRGHVATTPRSHISLVKFCQTLFGLPSIHPRLAAATDMLDCFDPAQPPLPPPTFG